MTGDQLLDTIIEAAKKLPVSAAERKRAIIRAGKIAECYIFDSEVEAVFGPSPSAVLDENVNLGSETALVDGIH